MRARADSCIVFWRGGGVGCHRGKERHTSVFWNSWKLHKLHDGKIRQLKAEHLLSNKKEHISNTKISYIHENATDSIKISVKTWI